MCSPWAHLSLCHIMQLSLSLCPDLFPTSVPVLFQKVLPLTSFTWISSSESVFRVQNRKQFVLWSVQAKFKMGFWTWITCWQAGDENRSTERWWSLSWPVLVVPLLQPSRLVNWDRTWWEEMHWLVQTNSSNWEIGTVALDDSGNVNELDKLMKVSSRLITNLKKNRTKSRSHICQNIKRKSYPEAEGQKR